MKYTKTDYRRIIELLELMPELRQAIGIHQPPHFTTVNKFFLRSNSSVIYAVFVRTVCLFHSEQTIVAMDSTGYSSTHASVYYAQRMHGEQERKTYIKTSLAVCTVNQSILAVKTRLGPRNDNTDFEWLARQSASLAKPAYITADKGHYSD
ncbi:MAG: transposase [Candidatus Aenigmatarchaeota archaeon]